MDGRERVRLRAVASKRESWGLEISGSAIHEMLAFVTYLNIIKQHLTYVGTGNVLKGTVHRQLTGVESGTNR